MTILSLILFVCMAMALIAVSVYSMLHSINESTCESSTVMSYDSILRDFNGRIFMSDNGRYSAEIVTRNKIRNGLNRLAHKFIINKSDKSIADAIAKKIDIVKKIDSSLKTIKDEVIYYIMTSTILEDNPSFVLLINNPRYITIVSDYNRQTRKFNKMLNQARTLVSSYTTINADASDYDIYNILMRG